MSNKYHKTEKVRRYMGKMIGAKRNLNLALNLAKIKFLGKRIPIFVVIRITNKCNFNCKYCDIRNQKPVGELKTSDWLRLLDDLSRMGTRKLCITGGEPLLHKDAGLLVDYAHKKGMFITFATNGSLVPKKINELKNVDILTMSLDGPEKIHELNRPRGSYQKVIDAVKVARSHNIPVWTNAVVTKQNINHIEQILDLAEQLGFLTTFSPVEHFDLFADDLNALSPDPQEFHNLARKLIEWKKSGKPVANSYLDLKDMLNYPNSVRNHTNCFAGRSYCNIDADGRVYPCSGYIKIGMVKKFTRVGIREAFLNIPELSCPEGCWLSCWKEYDYLSSLNPRAIFNAIRKINISKIL